MGSNPAGQPNQGNAGTQATPAGCPAPDSDAVGTGIRTGEIIGWRAWRCHDGRLWSMYFSHIVWPSDCLESADDILSYGWLGVHAFKDRAGAEEYLTWFRDWGGMSYNESRMGQYEARGFVLGEVALWGTVMEHQKGYRARFARPVRLVDADDSVRAYYGI